MLPLKSLLAACVFAVMVHPTLAANDARSGGSANGMQDGSLPAGTPPPATAPRGHGGIGTNAATCAKPRLTPEQQAERKARREERLAQGGRQHTPRTAEQKSRAGARRTARCDNAPR